MNTKTMRAQSSFWSASTIKLRALFHNTGQVENTIQGGSTGGSLANEVRFIGEAEKPAPQCSVVPWATTDPSVKDTRGTHARN